MSAFGRFKMLLNVSKDGTVVSARPSVREVPSSITSDLASLLQLLSVLCSFNEL